MTPVRLEPAAPRSRVKHSTNESLHSLAYQYDWERVRDLVRFYSYLKVTSMHVTTLFT